MAWVQEMDPLLFPLYQSCPRDKSVAIISQLQYLDHQAPREIIVCAGFIGASESTLALAKCVNECKDYFKAMVLSLKSAKIPLNDPELIEHFDPILVNAAHHRQQLKKMGLARLHLKQCYRKIPILPKAPQKISWTWANTRSIKKISITEATLKLHQKGNDVGIQLQLQKLNSLSPYESLAIVQDLAPHLRANLVFQQGNMIQRKMIKGPMPIFFPCDHQTALPDFKPPTPKKGRDENRMIRCDVRLEPTPFLPAIRAHRYTG